MRTFSLMSDPDKRLTLLAYENLVLNINIKLTEIQYSNEGRRHLDEKRSRLKDLIKALKDELPGD